jgi:hypothetical protein
MPDFSDQVPPGKILQDKTSKPSAQVGMSRRRVLQTLVGSAAAISAGVSR